MLEWFINLNDSDKIAIVVPVSLAIGGGIICFFVRLFRREDSSTRQLNETLKTLTYAVTDGLRMP